MIIFVVTCFWQEYGDYDPCGCGREESRDVEIFTTAEKALAKLKELREEQKNSEFKRASDGWYDVRVREIE